MTTSTFGAAFDALPEKTQRGIIWQLRTRRAIYEGAMRRGYISRFKVILLADTPGPGRPKDPRYHHTPFYSTKNSSLWLNKQLVEAGIDESALLWFNTTLADGSKLDPVHLEDVQRFSPAIVCLGGNAEKWARATLPHLPYTKFDHPQYAKRFRSKEPYPLIDFLKEKAHASARSNET